MSTEKVRKFLSRCGFEGRVREFDVSSATVALAAEALGVAPERIAKTLSFEDGRGCIMIVAAGDAKIDNHKFKAYFSRKAKMLPASEVEPLTGYPVGGVCPFGVNEGARVYLDASLTRFETVFPAAGTPNSAVELTPEELKTATGCSEFIDVCKEAVSQ